jgi:hypothetical protein
VVDLVFNQGVKQEDINQALEDSGRLVIILRSAGVAAWSRIPELLQAKDYSPGQFSKDFLRRDLAAIAMAKEILAIAVEVFGPTVELGWSIHKQQYERIAFGSTENRWGSQGSICPTGPIMLILEVKR